MSLNTPIFTVTCCASAVLEANTTASAANPKVRFIKTLPLLNVSLAKPAGPAVIVSHPEIVVELFEVGVQFRIGELFHDPAVFHDVIAVGDGRGEAEILFNEQNGKTLLLESADGAADLLDDDRREPLGRLVEQQKARAGAQDAPDGQHLLLAARQLGALAAQPLLQVGKQREDLLDAQAAGLHGGRQVEVLLDVEA